MAVQLRGEFDAFVEQASSIAEHTGGLPGVKVHATLAAALTAASRRAR